MEIGVARDVGTMAAMPRLLAWTMYVLHETRR